MKLYRVRVQAEIVATFEVRATSPDDAMTKTLAVAPKETRWLTGGQVVAIEEKTPEGWKAASPDERALIQAFDSAQDAINAGAGTGDEKERETEDREIASSNIFKGFM